MWEDLRAAAKRRIRKFDQHRDMFRQPPQPISQTTTEAVGTVHFTDPEWKDRPALDLFRDYLDKFENIVGEAEKVFAGGAGP